jgi:hypothetical protein
MFIISIKRYVCYKVKLPIQQSLKEDKHYPLYILYKNDQGTILIMFQHLFHTETIIQLWHLKSKCAPDTENLTICQGNYSHKCATSIKGDKEVKAEKGSM